MPEESEPQAPRMVSYTRLPEPLPVAVSRIVDGYRMTMLDEGGADRDLFVAAEVLQPKSLSQLVRRTAADPSTGFRRPTGPFYVHVVLQENAEEVEIQEGDPIPIPGPVPNTKDLWSLGPFTQLLTETSSDKVKQARFCRAFADLFLKKAFELEA